VVPKTNVAHVIAAARIEDHRSNFMSLQICSHPPNALPMAFEISSRVKEHQLISDIEIQNVCAQFLRTKKMDRVAAMSQKK
jgi:hypothetical protein